MDGDARCLPPRPGPGRRPLVLAPEEPWAGAPPPSASGDAVDDPKAKTSNEALQDLLVEEVRDLLRAAIPEQPV